MTNLIAEDTAVGGTDVNSAEGKKLNRRTALARLGLLGLAAYAGPTLMSLNDAEANSRSRSRNKKRRKKKARRRRGSRSRSRSRSRD